MALAPLAGPWAKYLFNVGLAVSVLPLATTYAVCEAFGWERGMNNWRQEETVAALRRFVADAAHELHTPLTALRTNLELAAEAGPEEERRFVAQAQEQASRLER